MLNKISKIILISSMSGSHATLKSKIDQSSSINNQQSAFTAAKPTKEPYPIHPPEYETLNVTMNSIEKAEGIVGAPYTIPKKEEDKFKNVAYKKGQ